MTIDTIIKERTSCRSFKTKELTDNQILEILDAARYAPSPKNRQPWRFVVLRKKDKSYFLKMIYDSFFKNHSLAPYETKLNEFNSEKASYRIMNEADSIILVFNAYPSHTVFGEEDKLFDCTNIQAIGAAIQNITLKATELGIGSLWICDIFADYQQICDTYNKEGQLVAAIALGYPEGTQPKVRRKVIDELLIKAPGNNTEKIIWVGPRESDIVDCRNMFSGSVTIFGTNHNDNISYCDGKNIRIDHNNIEKIDNSFWENGIRELKKNFPSAKLLYYNSEFSYTLPKDLQKDVICCNSLSSLKMLKNKTAMRMAFSEMVPVVPFQEIAYGDNIDLLSLYTDSSRLIFQENYSSGGSGTHIVNKKRRGILWKN